MFNPKGYDNSMKHDLVDLYKICTQDAPGMITDPAPEHRHLYISQAIIKKKKTFSGNLRT